MRVKDSTGGAVANQESGITRGTGATAQAEALLNRAFQHLRDSVDGEIESGFGSLFPHGVGEIEIRVDVRLSETDMASVDLRAKGNPPPKDEGLEYDEFDDPLMFEEDDEP